MPNAEARLTACKLTHPSGLRIGLEPSDACMDVIDYIESEEVPALLVASQAHHFHYICGWLQERGSAVAFGWDWEWEDALSSDPPSTYYRAVDDLPTLTARKADRLHAAAHCDILAIAMENMLHSSLSFPRLRSLITDTLGRGKMVFASVTEQSLARNPLNDDQLAGQLCEGTGCVIFKFDEDEDKYTAHD